MEPRPWSITINRFDGYAPAFWEDEWLTLGNRGHASRMQNVDMINPNVLTQGPGLLNLTNGDQSAAVTTLIKGLMRVSPDGTNIFGVGGNKFYKLTSSVVASDANFPHTIDKAAVTSEDGEDVAYYGGVYWFSYNHSGNAGDVGIYDPNAGTFDDDYMSTAPSGNAALQGGVPHQLIAGGDDQLYIANGRYMARLNGGVFVAQALDLPAGEVIVSHCWTGGKLYMATNLPNTTSSIQAESSIYIWDGTSDSWEYQIKVIGRIGALYVKGGIIYVFYQDPSSVGGFKIGVVSGASIQDIAHFTGSLPQYYQVSETKNHLIWISDGLIWAYGAPANNLGAKLFQYADAGYSTGGGLTNAFATPMVASSDGTNCRLANFSGYDTNGSWKSLMFDLADGDQKAIIDKIAVFTNPIVSGAKLDLILQTNYGANQKTLEQINVVNRTKHVVLRDSFELENCRLDLSFANGSTVYPVQIRKIIISGHFVDDI